MKMPWKQQAIALALGLFVAGQGMGYAQMIGFYRDVPSDHWASPAISRLSSQNIFTGDANQQFRPTEQVSRAEFAGVLSRGLNLEALQPVAQLPPYRDVQGNSYESAIIEVSCAGLMTGTTAVDFSPNQGVSRLDAMTAVGRALMMKQPGLQMTQQQAVAVLSPLADYQQIPAGALIPVAVAYQSGAVCNEPGIQTHLRPNAMATRAEVANLIGRTRSLLGLDPPIAGLTAPAIGGTVITPVSEIAPPVVIPVAEAPVVTPLIGQTQFQQVPTAEITFLDTIEPVAANVGNYFEARTETPILVNNRMYPAGSIMTGQMVAVQPPTNGGTEGVAQLVATGIRTEDNSCLAAFARPEDIHSTVGYAYEPGRSGENFLVRTALSPFRLTGGILGAGWGTTQGILQEAVGTTGAVITGTGRGLYDVATLQPAAAGGNFGQVLLSPFQGAGRIVGTTLQGGREILTTTTGEALYLLDPRVMGPTSRITAGQTVPITFAQAAACP